MNKRKLKKYAKKKGLPMPFVGSANKKKYFKTLGQFPLVKKLTGGQAKLDKNNNNRIDAEDFKILRGDKKPMKAALGAIALGLGAMGARKLMKKKSGMATPGIGAAAAIAKKKKEILGKKKGGEMKKDPTKPVNPFEKRRKYLGGAGSAIGRAAKAGLKFGVAGAALGAAGAGAAMLGRKIGKKLDERKARKRDEAKVQKKSVGGAMKFGANILKAYKKAGRSKEDAKKMIEALKSPGAKKSYDIMRKATGKNLRGDETFEEIMKMKKKMGGGMMNKPMGYKTGTVVEKYSPGTEGKIQKAANERLKDIKRNKRTEKNPRASGLAKKAAKKQTAFYQSGSSDQMGGPFKKPISQYKVGGTVMARGCKLGRKKPTKMY